MWEISLKGQLLSFAAALVLGAALCLFYDVLRALRSTGFNSFAAVTVTDIFFWLTAAVFTFLLLLGLSGGEIRGYVLLGEAAGFVLCRVTLSKLMFSVFKVCFKGASAAMRKIRSAVAKACAFICDLQGAASGLFRRFKRPVKKVLKKSKQLLYNKTNISKSEESSDGGKA